VGIAIASAAAHFPRNAIKLCYSMQFPPDTHSIFKLNPFFSSSQAQTQIKFTTRLILVKTINSNLEQIERQFLSA
jgi:hypothetical protein